MNLNKWIRAAKTGYLAISVVLIILGIALIAVPNFSAALLCRLAGVIMILFGLIKIVGYFSRDLYRLAFQFDLALGILLIALGAVLILRTDLMLNLICILLGVCILADALGKVQTSLDAKAFGIGNGGSFWRRQSSPGLWASCWSCAPRKAFPFSCSCWG